MARTDMMANGQSQTNPHIHLHGYRRKVFLFQMRAAPQPIVSSEKVSHLQGFSIDRTRGSHNQRVPLLHPAGPLSASADGGSGGSSSPRFFAMPPRPKDWGRVEGS